MKEKLAYLAIPYTWNAEESFEIANIVAAYLMEEGYVVFSPISHSHPISKYLPDELQFSQEFWMKQDLRILSLCDVMILVEIGEDGVDLIDESKGCQSEIKFAGENDIHVERLYYNTHSEYIVEL